MKLLLIFLLIVSIGLLSGCSEMNPNNPRLFTTSSNVSTTHIIQTNMTYYYSVDCNHNTICYFYYGYATTPSCVYVPIGVLNENGECK